MICRLVGCGFGGLRRGGGGFCVVRVAVGFGTVGLAVGSGGGVIVGCGDGGVGYDATGLGSVVTELSPFNAAAANTTTTRTMMPPIPASVAPTAVRPLFFGGLPGGPPNPGARPPGGPNCGFQPTFGGW